MPTDHARHGSRRTDPEYRFDMHQIPICVTAPDRPRTDPDGGDTPRAATSRSDHSGCDGGDAELRTQWSATVAADAALTPSVPSSEMALRSLDMNESSFANRSVFWMSGVFVVAACSS